MEADRFAGLFFAGVDVERGRKGRSEEHVSVKRPEGEKVELFWRAVEILAVEIDDLVDEGLGGFFGFHGTPV